MTQQPTKRHRKQPEHALQAMVAKYLRLQYPKVMFQSDMKAGSRTKFQQMKLKNIQPDEFANPDMVIYERCGGYGAMFLELKAETPYKRDGSLKAGEHLSNQQRDLERLRNAGYHADFYWEFEQIKKAIDEYLGAEL